MSTAYYSKIVKEDIDLGVSTSSVRNPGGGTLTGTQVNLAAFAVGAASGSDTWNPSSIGVGSFEAKDITVTGAALGDYAIASFSLDVQDLTLTANVTATNTVTCVLSNSTAAAVNLASGTIKVLVFHTS